VSEQAIYTWKKRFGSFQPDDVRRLKQLEQENARQKKLVAERDLEIEVMKEIAAKNGRRAGPSRAGGVCETPRVVATPVVHTAGDGALLSRVQSNDRRREKEESRDRSNDRCGHRFDTGIDRQV
jgi:putative transposase